MASDYKIGSFEFLDLPYPPQACRIIEVETRPGLAYHSIWVHGFRTEPFTFEAQADVASLAAGVTLFELWRDAIGTQLLITWAASVSAQKYDIIDVAHPAPPQSAVQKIILGVGGTAGTSLAMVTGIWTIAESPVTAAGGIDGGSLIPPEPL